MGTMENEEDENLLSSFGDSLNIAIIGGSGGIGSAIRKLLVANNNIKKVFQLSRSKPRRLWPKEEYLPIDYNREVTISDAASYLKTHNHSLDMIIVTTGVLHRSPDIYPEKTWRSLNRETMEEVFLINTIGPSLVAKHFLPLLVKGKKAIFAVLSARVGSIEDNKSGGWHSYRASKSALNMIIKTLSIELSYKNPSAICLALHPGTVDTDLSKPFQGNVQSNQLFAPQKAAKHLITVINTANLDDTGTLLAWDGKRVVS
jgi:NAD(P)-dependent dehydrogenase (short-subunit alcohol dehydrogenase family)